jgi:adenosylhomocysteine nucleosidase
MPSELRPFVRAAGLTRHHATGDDDGVGDRGPVRSRHYTGTVGNHAVVATTMGVGMRRATRTAEQMLARGDVTRLLVMGIAGGLDTQLPIGHVVVPAVVVDGATGTEHRPQPWDVVESSGRLVTFDGFVTDPETMAALQQQGFAAIDMETAATAAVCAQHGCPYTVFRAISDNATDGSVDPAVAAMARPDGTPDIAAAVRYMLRRPWRVPGLVRLGRDARQASVAAATAALTALRASIS